MKILMIDDGTSFFGTPVEIAGRLRARAHSTSRNLDAYMKEMADEYDFEIDGDSIEKRCDAFLAGMISVGPARPVFGGGVDTHAVRVLRNAIGLSREKLAGLLGVSSMTVTRWETEKHAIDPDRFERIKRVLFEPTSHEPSTRSTMETQTHAREEGSLMWSRQRVREQMRSSLRTGLEKPGWILDGSR